MALSQRRLGARGPEVPAVGIGTNNFGRRLDRAGAERVVDAALDEGAFLFDTADIYGDGDSERYLGEALRGRRDRAFVATKFGMFKRGLEPSEHRGSRTYVRRAVEESLGRLDTGWIDLYQMHEPDPTTPIEETLAELHSLVREGKVRWVGISNFSAEQVRQTVEAARGIGLTELVASQDEYSLLHRGAEVELIPAIAEAGLGLLPYYPLASGLLSGKYHRGTPAPEGSRLARPGMEGRLDPATFDVVEKLEAFASSRGIDLLTLAVGSLLGREVVASVISGAMSPEQVRANCAAAQWVAGAEDWRELDRITGWTRG